MLETTSKIVYGYTSEYYGDSTQLTYLRSRYYSSGTARFMTRDTWRGNEQMPMSFNRWIYVEGNPINYVDPSGFCVNCYVFFFPGLGNNGAHEIGAGENRLVEQIGRRTGARVTVMYPYGAGVTGNLSAFEKYKLIASLAYEKDPLPKYKAQEILGWLIVGLQLDGHVEFCYDGFDDDQLNVTFVGYSGGGQVAYSVAQALSGTLFVDNLVLFGAPYRAHDGLGNIGQIWDFVSQQDDVIFGTGAFVPWVKWREDNLSMYAYENATYCALAGDETTPYVHYDNGVNDYFGNGETAKFNGQSCFGAHSEQSITPQVAESIGWNRFEVNMAMLFAIIEGKLK